MLRIFFQPEHMPHFTSFFFLLSLLFWFIYLRSITHQEERSAMFNARSVFMVASIIIRLDMWVIGLEQSCRKRVEKWNWGEMIRKQNRFDRTLWVAVIKILSASRKKRVKCRSSFIINETLNLMWAQRDSSTCAVCSTIHSFTTHLIIVCDWLKKKINFFSSGQGMKENIFKNFIKFIYFIILITLKLFGKINSNIFKISTHCKALQKIFFFKFVNL